MDGLGGLAPEQVIGLLMGLIAGFRDHQLPDLMKSLGFGGLRRYLPKARAAVSEIFYANAWAVVTGALQVLGERDGQAIGDRFVLAVAEVSGRAAAALLEERAREYSSIMSDGDAGRALIKLSRAIVDHTGVRVDDPAVMITLAGSITLMIGTAREALVETLKEAGRLDPKR